jgi:hypothetical protein
MERWVITVDGRIVWEGTKKRTPDDPQLDAFVSQIYDNELPIAFPMVLEYNPRDWRHRVIASLQYARDLYGDPQIDVSGFDLDDIIPNVDVPKDALI